MVIVFGVKSKNPPVNGACQLASSGSWAKSYVKAAEFESDMHALMHGARAKSLTITVVRNTLHVDVVQDKADIARRIRTISS